MSESRRESWICKACREEVGSQTRSGSSSANKKRKNSGSGLSDEVEDREVIINEDRLYNRLAELIESTIKTKIEERCKTASEEIRKLEQEVALLKSKNTNLEERVRQLEKRQNISDQYSRKDNIIVSGVPELPDETPEGLAKAVFSAVGVDMQPFDVIAAHRLPPSRKKSDGATIIM